MKKTTFPRPDMRVSPTRALQQEDPTGEDVGDTDRSARFHGKENGDLSSSITRKKGQSGRAVLIQCIQCRMIVPRDKAIEKRKSTLPLDHRLRVLLRKKGAYVVGGRKIVYYCVSCAKHRRYV